MATTSLQQPSNLGARLKRARLQLFGPSDVTILLITIAMLVLPALALNAADWPLDMSVILPVSITSVVIGFLLARSRYNELLALLISMIYGAALVVLIAGLATPGGTLGVMSRTITWIVDAFTGGINQDERVFTLLVATLFWFLGYNAAWHVFRIDRVWRVILPPGLILVSNIVFYPGSEQLDIYLVGYLFLSLILIARSNLDAREWEWYRNGIRVPRRLRNQFLRVGAALALVVLLLAWIVPSGNLQEQLDQFQEFLRSDPMEELNDFWSRLFATVETEGPVSADYYGGDSLRLGGAISLGEQEVLLVEAAPDRRYYWRSRVFDTYELGNWTHGAEFELNTRNLPLEIRNEFAMARVPIDQTVTIAARSTRLLYAAPQPDVFNISTRTELDFINNPTGANFVDNQSANMDVSAVRPFTVLNRGDSYEATSLMSVATAFQLRETGTDYPQWILDHPQYLRDTSNVITEPVRELSNQIVAASGATNPYDTAKAIETWLRANITYNESIPAPPPDQDVMEWLLFDIQQGYCNYYATAMIVMLRAHDIPARMAAGFAQGTWDEERGVYVVQEQNAHTWVEAYFPGYGWIEFEPTAAQAQLNREGDDELPENSFNPQDQFATATPTATPTPLPTSTPLPTENPENADNQTNPNDPPTPTITPTFTPSPTVTPVIIPTVPPPINPEPRDPLSFILPALLLILVGIIVIGLLIAAIVFLYWWWEWRGMRGFSPITRAYARLERYLGLIGIRFEPRETPEERRRRVMRQLPGSERPVTAITRLYTTERYGPRVTQEQEEERRSDTADKAWDDARRTILNRWLRRFAFWRRDRE